MSNLIEERDERTRKRKKNKRRMDALIGLSYHDEEKQAMSLSTHTIKRDELFCEEQEEELSVEEVAEEQVEELKDKKIRLLDEGYFDQGFVIKKGTIEKFLNGQNEKLRSVEMDEDGNWRHGDIMNLTDDFVGTVNLGHMDFATFPFIIGEWRKEDLSLTDIGNDRVGLDVKLHLDKDSIFVKELKRQPYDIGISSEFYYSINDDDTRELTELLGYYTPVIDEIYIFAYGLVGECGNVNSSGLELKGEPNMDDKERMALNATEEPETVPEETEELVAEETVEEQVEELAEENEEEIIEESAETEEEVMEESAEETAEESADEGEETDIEEAEESFSDEEVSDEAEEDELSEVLSVVNELREQIATLSEQVESLTEANAELKKSNRRLQGKLKDEKAKKEAFIKNAKGISVKLGINEEKPVRKNIADEHFALGDGIGD